MAELEELVAAELNIPVDPRVTRIASVIAAQYHPAATAILFYGSCLREKRLDGLMIDFYLIVSDYSLAYDKRWLGIANRLIPPNVFYVEHQGLSAKYAVLSEADFAHECSSEAWTVSTAARFAQPSRLVWSASAEAAERAVHIVSRAAPSLLGWTACICPPNVSPGDLWKTAFAMTFAAELRAERNDRSASIVDADPERYQRFAEAAMLGHPQQGRTRGWWRRKQLHGKIYSLARLAKASLTFAGGADYIAWKINRHAGTSIELTKWQRRHPLLAGISLLPRLLKTGAVR